MGESSEPYNTLIKAFSSYGDINREKLRPLVPYLERRSVPEGTILWEQNEDPDGLYIIESGVLRASYKFADHTPSVEESMVPGTLAGELSALAGLPRNATVVVERQAVLWKLTIRNLRRLEKDNPALATTFMQLVLKGDDSRFMNGFEANESDSCKNRLRCTPLGVGNKAITSKIQQTLTSNSMSWFSTFIIYKLSKAVLRVVLPRIDRQSW